MQQRFLHCFFAGVFAQQIAREKAVFQAKLVQKCGRNALGKQRAHLVYHACFQAERQALSNTRIERLPVPGDAELEHGIAGLRRGAFHVSCGDALQQPHDAVSVVGRITWASGIFSSKRR